MARRGGPLRVTSFADLESKLEGAAVVLRAEKRRQTIESALRAAGPVEDDHGLVDEWQDLVEHPAVVIGQVPSEFRSLPREVLETVLVHHQKYVPLLESGSVVRFAALTNSDGKAAAPIVRNMERVVVARLRDAAFFWKEDRKRPLARPRIGPRWSHLPPGARKLSRESRTGWSPSWRPWGGMRS